MKEAVIAELTQHAADELRHADMVTMRIIQLGGVPVSKPESIFEVLLKKYLKLFRQNVLLTLKDLRFI